MCLLSHSNFETSAFILSKVFFKDSETQSKTISSVEIFLSSLINSFSIVKSLVSIIFFEVSFKNILKKDSIIFLTNWALDSEINKEKFKNSEVVFTKKDFQNESDFEEKQKEKDFQSKDFSIKFSWFYRYYHCFTLEELDFLFKKADFEIIENRLFDNWRNFISILKNNL